MNRCGRVAAGLAASLLLVAPAAAQTGTTDEPSPSPPPAIHDPGDLRGPRQPIFFRHDVHAGQFQIPCLYCHNTVTVSSTPGIPSLRTCMGCHQLLSGGQRAGVAEDADTVARNVEIAEVEKLTQAWRDQQPPEWVRIHAVPQFVRFPHMRHVRALGDGTDKSAAATCVLCHGDVGGMAQVYQVESLKMGWCIQCHVQRDVTRDCTVCHY
jgi:hypothetical protein